MCNDSCYGPVSPFSELFAEMAKRREDAEHPADFWGMSLVHQYGRKMIPSYFYVFGPAVLEGSELDRWFDRMEPCGNRGQVILRCESVLTQYLIRSGYEGDGLVPESFQPEHKATSIKFPLPTMRDFRDPLVKVKALKGDSLEDLDEVCAFLKANNPELAAMIPKFSSIGSSSGMDVARNARLNHGTQLVRIANKVHQRVATAHPIRILLLSLTGEECWVRELCAHRAAPSRFAMAAAVIPDLRIIEKTRQFVQMRNARKKIMLDWPDVRLLNVRTDNVGEWQDVAALYDIIVYSSADNVSDFHYNPHYAVGRDFLPVLFFDRRSIGPYPLEKEFARQNYAYFWKVFFPDREAFDLYAMHSIRKGENAVFAESGNAVATAIRVFTECLLK